MKNQDLPMLDLFDRTPDLVCIVDKPGWFKKVNPAVVSTLGYTQEELFARPVSALIHPDDREITSARRTRLLNQEPLLNFQNRYIAKNGNIVWLEWTSVYLPEKEIVFAIAKNITSRKLGELEIEENYKKFKSLAIHFKNNIEKDRRYFAVELHEELAQLATAIKMNVESLNYITEIDEAAKKRIQYALSTSDLLINKARKLSYSINPGTIAEMGLNEVLKWLCNEFTSLTGIACHYKGSVQEDHLTPEIKLDFFRICQEALLNVMHHAQASVVTIKLERKKNTIRLSVIDNGVGFDHEEERQTFGLTSMQGRADSIDGELFIESKTNKGTKVSVSVPTKKAL
jgi:PAS domain S-box-containing protein